MRTLGLWRSSPAAVVAAVFISPSAFADEPVAAKAPRLLRETAEVTTVIDAFDDQNPFDLNIVLGFDQSWKSANIRRETELNQPGLTTGGYVSRSENVARFSQSISTLLVGLDIGLWKDLALGFRMPIVLSDSRELADLSGSSINPERFLDTTGTPLFKLPFRSPTRSGIDWLGISLDYAIFNQQRDPSKATWVVGVEGRFAVGAPIHACNNDAKIKCPDPANPASDRDAGLSRAMNAILARTILSKRFGYVEPYVGFDMMVEIPQSRGDYGSSNDFKGALLNLPPIVGTLTTGVEVIPYENREAFTRFVGDFKLQLRYHSPGRDYSELFDALGSSQAPTLRAANPGGYHQNPKFGEAGQPLSVPDPGAQKSYFAGITDQQGYGSLRGSIGATWQANRYIKFKAALGVQWNQAHIVTSADPCNPAFTDDAKVAGPCRGTASSGGTASITGIPNPNYRAVIDAPGRRFTVDDTIIVNLSVGATVMF